MMMGIPGALVCTSANGTLGILVRRNGAGCFLLSCSHVVAKSGRFSSAFNSLSPSQRAVVQPVSCDATMGRLGLLQAGYSIIATNDVPGPDGRTDNAEDCGLVMIDAAVAVNLSPVQKLTSNTIRLIAQEDPASWEAGMTTRLLGIKRGSLEDATGHILRFAKATSLWYPLLGDVTFRGGILYNTRCEPGDSGAPVTDEQNRLLGMHIAGDGTTGLFMPLRDYFKANHLSLF